MSDSQHANAKRRAGTFERLGRAGQVLCAVGALGAALAIWLLVTAVHVERRLRHDLDWEPTRLYAAEYWIPAAPGAPPTEGGIPWLEIAALPDARGRLRIPVPLESLPPVLIDAVLLVEDRRFFEHPGVDVRRIGGALLANWSAGRLEQGGSTITQQLARSVALGRERTLGRKLREAAAALLLEARYDKRTLLGAYLNEVYLAQDGVVALHGVEAASRHVFGKPAAMLGVAEAALLVGLAQAPSGYAPARHPERARARRAEVLTLLRNAERISAAEHAVALAAPLVPTRSAATQRARHALAYAKRELVREFGADRLARGGLRVRTTLDWRLQSLAERAVSRGLVKLETAHPALRHADRPLEGALVALDPETGAIRALVGGRDFGRSEFDHATVARRQPGSVFKPFVLLAAVGRRGERAPRYTLASPVEDAPFDVPMPDGTHWSPQNHDHGFRGDVTLRFALEESLNVPFARLGLAAGLDRVVAIARALGIETRLEPVPSLSLGTFETDLLGITRAYATLAAGGVRRSPTIVAEVHDANGATIAFEAGPAPTAVVTPAEAFVVTSALQGAANRGSAAPLRRLGFLGDVAIKTGSTDGFRDGWVVGYTPELALGVWVGFDDGRSIHASGGESALPIVADFLISALGPSGRSAFRAPVGLQRGGVRVPFGGICMPALELFLEGTATPSTCRRAAAQP